MNITLSDNIFSKVYVAALNGYEKFTHYWWNRKPQYVECIICWRRISSEDEKDSPSPEERGWKCTKDGYNWICHQCLCHRDFRPYLDQADEEERKLWEEANKKTIEQQNKYGFHRSR